MAPSMLLDQVFVEISPVQHCEFIRSLKECAGHSGMRVDVIQVLGKEENPGIVYLRSCPPPAAPLLPGLTESRDRP